MNIADVEIGLHCRPAIIAEMSGNHNQSLDRALKIVDAAVEAGVHLLKLQTYTADTITLDVQKEGFLIDDENSLWAGRTLYSLYEEAHTPWEWQEAIITRAQSRGVPCFSSVFDDTSVEFLEGLNIAAYKFASQEIVHLPLIELVAKLGKPMILSTGMATISEIGEAVEVARTSGCVDLALLKCTSSYPASAANSNVVTIPEMRKIFNCEVGLSDHTLGLGAAIAAVSHGATLIEKHLTLSRSDGGVDSDFSMEPNEMQLLVEESESARLSLGKVYFGPSEAEQASMSGRRSIYSCKPIKKGEFFCEENVRVVRPNLGMEPKFFKHIIGRKAKIDLDHGTPISWDVID
tara:strand:+ start:158 stop:1201 length:1044 start_codon:yes stop_codon:yes gene_type:complete